MKLKTFLMGTASALMAVTTANAADAVIAEPEPVEYVRVCDAYGAGYFFIPGTETCLNINGEVRAEYIYNDVDGGASDGDFAYRARLNVQAANETDFGTLSSYLRFQGGATGPNGNAINPVTANGVVTGVAANFGDTVFVDRALISLGGLSFGYSDYFWARNQGYGLLGAINDGAYGFNQSIFAEYTYAANGFSITGGLEQTYDDTVNAALATNTLAALAALNGTVAQLPGDGGENLNYYIGGRYSGSWGFVSAQAMYDGVLENGAYNVATNLIFGDFRVEAFYSYFDGPSVYSLSSQVAIDGDYAWGVGASYTFGDFTPYVLYSDRDGNFDNVAVGVVYSGIQGLSVQLEADFQDGGRAFVPATGAFAAAADRDQYRLRVVRSF